MYVTMYEEAHVESDELDDPVLGDESADEIDENELESDEDPVDDPLEEEPV